MTDIRHQLETTLSGTYTLERELGGGGMSRVFLADELRLGRKVVVKVLSPELAAGISAERFEREIKLAASLQQANIVPVLSAGDAAGLPFYTMPYVEGESLRARLGQPPPPTITETLRILGDVARALQYAHDRGIVHRDIKPDNVLLSGGTAVVTDFGIAKALSASRTHSGDATLTQLGTSIGTPAYMAPEQAAGDPDVDARADIYAFGCLAYELLAGRPPFHERSPQRVLAAHMGEAPQPIGELRPGLSPALAALVMRCLAKDPNERPQTAAEIARALDSVTSGDVQPMPAILHGAPGALRRALAVYAVAFVIVAVVAKAAIVSIGLPDWVFPGALVVMALGLPMILFTGYAYYVTRRALTATPTYTPGGSPSMQHGTVATIALKAGPHVSWRRTATAGGWAIGGFAVLVAAFMALRTLGVGPFGSLLAAGKLDDKQPLIVDEFRATGPDTTLGAVVSEAVRADLEQSSAITLLSQRRVNAALQRMQRQGGGATYLDLATAREVAAREGVKAIVDGEVRPLGTGFLVTVRLIPADSGDELASFRRTADTPTELIATIGELSRDLRGRIGESLKHMQRTPPLAQVATASLPALRKYTLARAASDAGDVSQAIALYEEAAAIDTSFASAYRAVAIQLGNLGGNRDRQFMYFQKAYDHRDRLPEVERYLAVAAYFGSGPHADRAKSIEAYDQLLELDPNNATALNNVAVQYVDGRNPQKAVEYMRRLVATDSSASLFLTNLFRSETAVGNWAAADSAYTKALRLFPASSDITAMTVALAIHRGRRDSVAGIVDRTLATNQGGPVAVQLAQGFAADVERSRGHLAESTRRARIASQAALERGTPAAPLTEALDEALLDAWDRDRPALALARSDSALSRWPLASLAAVDRPYYELGMIDALAGRTDRARAMVTELEHTSSGTGDDLTRIHSLRSLVALVEHHGDEAIAEAKEAQTGRCTPCTIPVLARAYDLAGQSDSAIAEFTRFVDDPSTFGREAAEGWYLAGTYKRLGELWEAKGDREKAASYYMKFVELWRTADPELQPKVAEVRRRVVRLEDGERR